MSSTLKGFLSSAVVKEYTYAVSFPAGFVHSREDEQHYKRMQIELLSKYEEDWEATLLEFAGILNE